MRPPAGIFREYDIRGVVGRELDVEAADVIARAFGTYLRDAGVDRAVVGHDNR
ncbi:MAG TPA: phosphomannomutase, partial [bacterium]|nr:phosphomannomutase [bacterium]